MGGLRRTISCPLDHETDDKADEEAVAVPPRFEEGEEARVLGRCTFASDGLADFAEFEENLCRVSKCCMSRYIQSICFTYQLIADIAIGMVFGEYIQSLLGLSLRYEPPG